MNKINNFKVHFSNVLLDKYHLTYVDINNYWLNKEKQEQFDNKKMIGTIVGLSELISSSSLCFIEQISESVLIVPIIIFAGIGAITTKISVSIKNPYYLAEYREIDKEYIVEKTKYKKINKNK